MNITYVQNTNTHLLCEHLERFLDNFNILSGVNGFRFGADNRVLSLLVTGIRRPEFRYMVPGVVGCSVKRRVKKFRQGGLILIGDDVQFILLEKSPSSGTGENVSFLDIGNHMDVLESASAFASVMVLSKSSSKSISTLN